MGFAQLAFTPGADWVADQRNGTTYQNIVLPVPREMYGRRLYVFLGGGANFLVRATISFGLNGRVVYQIPYIVGPSTGVNTTWMRLPGGPNSSSMPGGQNAIQVQMGTVNATVHPWHVTLAANSVSLSIQSSTVVGSAQQLLAVHSQHRW